MQNKTQAPIAQIILASQSPYRKELLGRIVSPFISLAPDVDEEILKGQITNPKLLAQKLAALKCQDIFSHHQDSIVIGSDQVLEFEDVTLGKPGSHERALQQLQILQGKTHRLLTAVHIMAGTEVIHFMNETSLKMKSFSRPQLEQYLLADKPYDCAGSYKIESKGIGLFENIDCSDFTAIVGLPLIELSKALASLGWKEFT